MDMNEGMIMMKGGRVLIVENGELLLLEDETTMPDGTKIRPNGQMLLTDGSIRMMVEGETLRKAGEVAENVDMPEMGPTDEMTDTETHDPG